MTRFVLLVAGVAIIVPMFLVVLGSVLGDVAMLIDAWGLWGVPLFFAVAVSGSLIEDRTGRGR